MQIHDDKTIEVSELTVYPIKGCAGINLSSLDFDKFGVKYDRNWGIANSKNKIITQRDNSKLALIKTEIEANCLKISAPGFSAVSVPIEAGTNNQNIEVEVWGDKCLAHRESDQVANALTNYLGEEVSLARIDRKTTRPVKKEGSESKDTNIAFQDGFPILVISESSLEDLNSKLDSKVKMNRFRPNIVVRGCNAYEEDNWRQIKIGSQHLNFVEKCPRCVVTTIDQETGTKGKEPLTTLSRERKENNKILFGNYAIHLNLENINVGDRLNILL